jgi:biopolymer transport protein ExbD
MNSTITMWLILAAVALAQPPALRQGISVEMAPASSAAPMPEADQAEARIVAVTRSGDVYWDVAPVTPAALTEQLRLTPNARVYVKADTRASYASVATVLNALRAAGAGNANLLTSQTGGALPTGVEVSLGAVPDSPERAVALNPAGPVLFGDVMRIIDASRSAALKVFLR